MLTLGALDKTFRMYWADMERCRAGGAYWSLLHVTVCLPDICAALESQNGRTLGKLYIAWCDTYLQDKMLTGEERFAMRSKVLHEGRAHVGQPDRRYSGFAFSQPAANGQVDHRCVDGRTLVLDVGELSKEYESGVRAWIRKVEAQLADPVATNDGKNLETVVQIRPKPMLTQVPSGAIWNNRTS